MVEVVTLGPRGAVGGVEVQQLLLYPFPRRRHRRPAARPPRPHAAPASTAASAGGPGAGGEGEAGVGEGGRGHSRRGAQIRWQWQVSHSGTLPSKSTVERRSNGCPNPPSKEDITAAPSLVSPAQSIISSSISWILSRYMEHMEHGCLILSYLLYCSLL